MQFESWAFIQVKILAEASGQPGFNSGFNSSFKTFFVLLVSIEATEND